MNWVDWLLVVAVSMCAGAGVATITYMILTGR